VLEKRKKRFAVGLAVQRAATVRPFDSKTINFRRYVIEALGSQKESITGMQYPTLKPYESRVDPSANPASFDTLIAWPNLVYKRMTNAVRARLTGRLPVKQGIHSPVPVQPVEELMGDLAHHLLIDGLPMVVDLEKSVGRHIFDSLSGRRFLDFHAGHASMILGFNHPRFKEPRVQADLLAAARTKLANSDMYSAPYARFVEVFHRVLGLPPLERYFFIEGGALAVENALKAAMDWKARRNLAAGRGPRGTEILHFERAFHGRSGYTLSLTNTDPRKTEYFAKFNWPRVAAPSINFELPEPERTQEVTVRERAAGTAVREILEAWGIDIAAIIIEPIQGEGGDIHFRGEWLAKLRRLCDVHEVLLIFDEVQTGSGTTGARWCCEHFSVLPDLLAFGKKAQVCGVMAGPRLDEVSDNCFRLSGRINSTWGGNLADMVRATHSLMVVEQDRLIENAGQMGQLLVEGLHELANEHPFITAPRGRGLMVAFDLPDGAQRDAFQQGLFEVGLLTLHCGDRSIRFRPTLDVCASEIAEALALIKEQCRRYRGTGGPAAVHKTAVAQPIKSRCFTHLSGRRAEVVKLK